MKTTRSSLGAVAVLLAGVLAGAATLGDRSSTSARADTAGIVVSHLREDGTRVRCPPIRRAGLPQQVPVELEGGCAISTPPREVQLSALSPLGEVRFGSGCDLQLILLVGGAGKVAAIDTGVGGRAPCNDARPCFEGSNFDPLTWRGRIEAAAGGPRLVLEACFDTCLGHFAGPVTLELRRAGDRWRIERADVTAGTSGWRIVGGGWPLVDSEGLEIATRGS